MINLKQKKGLTLVEIILVMVISFMIIGIVWNFLSFSSNANRIITSDFELQSDMRNTMNTINDSLRQSTAAFLVNEDHYKPQISGNGQMTGLVQPWNYIGLNEEKNKVIHFIYSNNGYYADVLAEVEEGVELSLHFSRDNYDNERHLIFFKVLGHRDGKLVYEVETEVQVDRAVNIIDWGSSNKPAKAIAYRTEDTPKIIEPPKAAISMVLDTSGSMTFFLDGSGYANLTNPPENSRIRILQRTLNVVINDLKNYDNIFLAMIPFASDADIPHPNANHCDKISTFRAVNSVSNWNDYVKKLKAQNGTNTGDGMRRAYFQHVDFNQNHLNDNIENYMIILVDGVTNQYSWLSKGGHNYFQRTEGNAVNVSGSGNALDANGTRYVEIIGEIILENENLGFENNIFVVGFSDKPSDLGSIADIARSVSINIKDGDVADGFIHNDRVFIAKSEDDLRGAFTEIGKIIIDDLWHVQGPRLNK